MSNHFSKRVLKHYRRGHVRVQERQQLQFGFLHHVTDNTEKKLCTAFFHHVICSQTHFCPFVHHHPFSTNCLSSIFSFFQTTK